MKRLFKFKYPKLALLLVCIVATYFIFKNPIIADFILGLGKLRYLGLFIAGMLFAFGFSAPFAVGFFLTLNPSNIWLAGIIAGLGAVLADLLIFNFIKFSFEDEFKRLGKSKATNYFNEFIGKSFGGTIKKYPMYVFAGIIIASPLPDEVGVIMLAGLTKINQLTLAILGFILNTLGILILLNI